MQILSLAPREPADADQEEKDMAGNVLHLAHGVHVRQLPLPTAELNRSPPPDTIRLKVASQST